MSECLKCEYYYFHNIGIRLDNFMWDALEKHDPEYYNELKSMLRVEVNDRTRRNE